MKLYLTFIFLACLQFVSFSQRNSSFDYSLGGYVSSRTLSTNDEDVLFVIQSRKDELVKFGASTSVSYCRQIGARFAIKVGLQYSELGFKTPNFTDLQWGNQIDSSFQYDPTIPSGEEIAEVQFIYEQRFIGVPLGLQFIPKQNKLSPYIEACIIPSYRLLSMSKQITNVGTKKFRKETTVTPNNNFYVVGMIGIGLRYPLTEHVRLFCQPTFLYHFTPTADAPIKERLYGIGLQIGVRGELSHAKP